MLTIGKAFNVYGHDPIGVGVRGIPVGFSILAGACIVLWLLSVFRGHNKELLIISSVLMTAGCGALAVARTDNLYQLWGILVVAGLGIGGKYLQKLFASASIWRHTNRDSQVLWYRHRSSVSVLLERKPASSEN